ncbi:undecaprenyl-diphosphate phosphatase [candidate division WOR-3 bacterium]|nr:undecaprenyl-diphosphate phosphatase [candidate division WOR-3 bacterium]
MGIFHSFILGIVQGLTEFFPISSSAHLALLEGIFGIKSKLTITVFLHFGSLIALIVVMWKDIKEIIINDRRLILFLIIGSIPAGVFGLFLKDKVALIFESPFLIGIALVVTGIILWLTRNIKEKRKKIRLLDAILIGIAQAIAIVPGISRSGITISAGIYLGAERVQAAKFSFLLAIISILGANIIETKNIVLRELPILPIFIGIAVSFLVSYFAIKVLLRIVKRKGFSLFSLYCWALGFFVLFS